MRAVFTEHPAAQHGLDDLAVRIARKWLGIDRHVGWNLERGEVLGNVGANRRHLDNGASAELHRCRDLFTEYPIGQAEDRRIDDGRMREQNVLALHTVDVLSPADDHLLRAIQQVDEALCVDTHDVAGVQPTLSQGFRIGIGPIPVAPDDGGSEICALYLIESNTDTELVSPSDHLQSHLSVKDSIGFVGTVREYRKLSTPAFDPESAVCREANQRNLAAANQPESYPMG